MACLGPFEVALTAGHQPHRITHAFEKRLAALNGASCNAEQLRVALREKRIVQGQLKIQSAALLLWHVRLGQRQLRSLCGILYSAIHHSDERIGAD